MSNRTQLRVAVLLRRPRGPSRRARSPDLIGRCERSALAAALSLKLQAAGVVTAIAVGAPRVEQRILELALRAGCDRAVEVLYPGADAVDYLGAARVIAAVLRRNPVDVVVCGARSQDDAVGAVGPAVAELLDIPHLAGLVDLEVACEALVATQRSDGQLHRFRCNLPLVACVETFDRKGRAAPIPGAIVESIPLDDLDLRAAEISVRSDFVGAARAARARTATIVSGASELMSRLAADDLLGG
jgi:electron transfer flavoprotein beta subunit